MCWLASWVQKYLKLSLPKHLPLTNDIETRHWVSVVTSLFFGGVIPYIVTTETVTTETCYRCFGSDKKVHIILIFGGNKLHFSMVMQFFLYKCICILLCFSSLCDGCHRTTAPVRSPHTSYRWRGERVIEPIKWMGIIRKPWLTRASGGNLARIHRGYTPTLNEKCHGIFNDHRESGPWFNISSERRMRNIP